MDITEPKIWAVILLIFVSSLFLIIGITSPGLQVNDEWITVNQLHQLIQGHQVLTNEGKYGTSLGTMIGYFTARHNILGYSLFLPIISYLPLLYILKTGDLFRFWIVFLWSCTPFVLITIFQWQFASKSRLNNLVRYLIGLTASGMLLFLNILWYYPFSSEFSTAPIESAAVVLAENVIFAILSVVIF